MACDDYEGNLWAMYERLDMPILKTNRAALPCDASTGFCLPRGSGVNKAMTKLTNHFYSCAADRQFRVTIHIYTGGTHNNISVLGGVQNFQWYFNKRLNC